MNFYKNLITLYFNSDISYSKLVKAFNNRKKIARLTLNYLNHNHVNIFDFINYHDKYLLKIFNGK